MPALVTPAGPAILSRTQGALRICGNRGYLPINKVQANTAQRLRHHHRIKVRTGAEPLSELRLALCHYYVTVDTETLPGNAIVWRAALEMTAPARSIAWTWDGATSVTMSDGQAIAIPDAILPSAFGLSEFPANTDVWIRLESDLALNGYFPNGGNQGAADQYASGDGTTSQLTNTGVLVTPGGAGGVLSATGTAQTPPFIALIGRSRRPAEGMMFVGDSIAMYFHDSDTPDGAAGGGFLARGLYNAGVGWSKMCRSSGTAQGTVAGWTRRQALIPYCSTFLCEYAVNDVAAGRSAAQVFADLQSIWATARAAGAQRIVQTLVSTKTGSTDAWATVANQTPASGFETGGVADQLRALIVAATGTPTGPDQVFDPRPYWDDGGVTNVWAAGGQSDDGLHPLTPAHVAAAAGIAAMAQAWARPLR